MKRKTIVILLLSILLLTGCQTKEEKFETQKETAIEKVTTNTQDMKNVTINSIKESYDYIKENINNKKVYEDLIYHATYLETIGSYSKTNKITILSTKVLNKLKQNQKNDEEITKLFKEIDSNKDKLIEELYTNYHTTYSIKKILKEQDIQVRADLNSETKITKENIKKAITYIETHLNNPLENDEILNNIVYYSLYLELLSKEECDITLIGAHIHEYLKTLDNNELENASKHINIIKKDLDKHVSVLYNKIKNN